MDVVDERNYAEKHELALRITDGMAANAATESASNMTSYLCGATSKECNCFNTCTTRTINEQNRDLGKWEKNPRRIETQLGLVIGNPKPRFGSSNDGNTAPRSSKIWKFHVILHA